MTSLFEHEVPFLDLCQKFLTNPVFESADITIEAGAT